MAFRAAAAAIFLCLSVGPAHTRIYDRCELAQELRDVHEFPEHQVATWVCIAYYESHFNTSAHNPGSGDHGIFQISQLYWCSPPGDGFACGLPCSALKDNDIEDDAVCARRIYRQHQRMSGDGFTAWVVYNLHCKNPAHVATFIQGCFDEENFVNKYDYQPIYQAMNLPTVIVPMPGMPFFPPIVPTTPPSASPIPTQLPPQISTTFPKVQFKPTVVITVPQEIYTTDKPSVSVYNPSTGFTTPTKVSPYKPISSTYVTKPFIYKPRPTTPKPATPKVTKASTYRFSSTSKIKPTAFQIKIPSYKSTPATFTLTTPRPQISTYKPFLNRFSSPHRPNEISATTSKPSTGISTYKPFLNQFSTSYKMRLTSSPFTSSTLFINKYDSNKAAVVKPRETQTMLPVTVKSGVNPFQFKRNETLYAFVRNPGYMFAISSSGFKFVRTAK